MGDIRVVRVPNLQKGKRSLCHKLHTRRALDVRNRVATLLVDRMSQLRAAARFVFRNQPEIARQASSAFERRRRRASKGNANKPNTADNNNPSPHAS